MKALAPAISLSLIALGLWGCRHASETRTAASHADHPSATTAPAGNAPVPEAPLLLEDEPPLLLEETMDPGQPGQSGADNTRCAVCHLNLIQEELALTHARADIGCAGCHGPSDAHIADESWASGGNGTAPDVMFPKQQINPACLKCHPREKLPSEEHEAFLTGKSEEKFCTDCHGEHRLVERKCRWK